MKNKQMTTKLYEKTLKKLRLIRGITGEPAAQIVERLTTEELGKALDKLPKKDDKDDFNAT